MTVEAALLTVQDIAFCPPVTAPWAYQTAQIADVSVIKQGTINMMPVIAFMHTWTQRASTCNISQSHRHQPIETGRLTQCRPQAQGRTGPFLVAGLPRYKAYQISFWQGFPRQMYAKVLRASSKCRRFPVTAFGHAVSITAACGAPAGWSYPAQASQMA